MCFIDDDWVKPNFDNAVKNDDGSLENFLLRINGKGFRCECGCNVFHIPDKANPDVYKCNACTATFTTTPKD